MPIVITHEFQPYNLGTAYFTSTTPGGGDRLISASAERSAHLRRPIRLGVTSDEHHSGLNISLDEAEALVACLTHAIALRLAAEAAAPAKKEAA